MIKGEAKEKSYINTSFIITKWCKLITDDSKDWNFTIPKELKEKYKGKGFKFRMMDDDNNIYCYGYCTKINFIPIDMLGKAYGCVTIQYKEDGEYKTL